MSDVWQGPGWWLASDGKWYPADAEPGAFYEGDTQQTDPTPAPGLDSTPAVSPDPTDVDYSTNDLASVPDVPASPTYETSISALSDETPINDLANVPPITPAPEPSSTLSFGSTARESDATSEPTANAGGWQAIEPETDEEIPKAPSNVDDGWTSAFEERQVVSDILGVGGLPAQTEADPSLTNPGVPPAPAVPTAPTMPEVAMPPAEVIQTLDTNAAVDPVVNPPISNLGEPSLPDIAMPTVDSAPTIDSNPIPTVDPAVTPPISNLGEPSLPDITLPTVDSAPTIDSNPIPTIDTPTAGIPGAGNTPGPISRDAAWRSPNETPINRPEVHGGKAAAPVVDLAVPQDAAPPIDEPKKRGVGPVLAGILGLAVLIGAAFVIFSLLAGGEDDQAVEAATPSTSVAPEPDVAPADDDGTDTTSVFELRAGDCIVGDIGSGQVTEVTKVDCEVEHQFEVYREVLIDSSITTFDEGAISAYAEDVCRTSLEAYVPPTDPRGLSFKFLQPTEDSWNQADEPDRVITCLLFDDDAPLVGRASEE